MLEVAFAPSVRLRWLTKPRASTSKRSRWLGWITSSRWRAFGTGKSSKISFDLLAGTRVDIPAFLKDLALAAGSEQLESDSRLSKIAAR